MAEQTTKNQLWTTEGSPLFCTDCKSEEIYAVFYCEKCEKYLCENCFGAHKFIYCFEEHTVVKLNVLAKEEVPTDKLLKKTEEDLRQLNLHAELLEQSKVKTKKLNSTKLVKYFSSHLQNQYDTAQNKIDETFNFYCSALKERKQEILKELEDKYNSKMAALRNNVQEACEDIEQLLLFDDCITNSLSDYEIIIKQIFDLKLKSTIDNNTDVNASSIDLEFVSNYNDIEIGVRNTFGYIRNHFEDIPTSKPQLMDKPNRCGSANSLELYSKSISDISPYEKCSSSPTDIFQYKKNDSSKLYMELVNAPSKSISASQSQIKRKQIKFYSRFKAVESKEKTPCTVAVNAESDIIYIRLDSPLIKIFEKQGTLRYKFGQFGMRDGRSLNGVAVAKTSGDIIVTENKPKKKIYIFNKYGKYIRSFGENVLQNPRAITVDSEGRIIVLESKIMRVVLFDQLGNILQKLNCRRHLAFPNAIVANDKQEIFISDYRAHRVKVFNYDGELLRQIGGERITNRPIGVCINQKGEIIVASNTEKFYISVFTQDGQLVKALESEDMHAPCFNFALIDKDSLVLACRDNFLYLYSYN